MQMDLELERNNQEGKEKWKQKRGKKARSSGIGLWPTWKSTDIVQGFCLGLRWFLWLSLIITNQVPNPRPGSPVYRFYFNKRSNVRMWVM